MKKHLSMDDFCNWLQHQEEPKTEGREIRVEARVNIRRIADEMSVEEGDGDEIVKEFKQHGGLLIQTDEDLVMIECKKGTFICPKRFVKNAE